MSSEIEAIVTAVKQSKKYRDTHEETIRALAELPQVCPGLHLPVQSGSNAQLERMRRDYTVEEYRDLEIIRRRDKESITMGRDLDCSLVIANNRASRKHCTIERHQEKFVLADHSTNGTYITAEGSTEILLQREEFRLGKHGWIAFGQPRAEAEEVVEYFCG